MAKKKKQAILCPNCKSLISRDEVQCPYCGIRRPGTWWKHNFLTQGFRDGDYILIAIIYVNIGLYVLSLLLNIRGTGFSANPLALLSPDTGSLVLLGAAGAIPINQFHAWWSLLSANYLHGGILHILFNMLALRQLGPLVVAAYGQYRMFIIYTLGGIFGF